VPAPDVVIVGAGIVGAACALACSREKLRVRVIEAGPIGGGATAAGMGHLVVMDDSEAQFALTKYSVDLWHEIAKELPADCEYVKSGTVWVAADDEEFSHVAAKREFYNSRGVRAEILDAAALAEAEPHLRGGLAGGLLVPDDAVVYPPCAAGYLLERAQENGAELILGKRVSKIAGGSLTLDGGEKLSAAAIVNAAGSWATKLTPEVQIRPRKGHLVITDRYAGFARHQLVELGYLKSAHSIATDSVAFNIQPRPTGQMLIGSSRQFDTEDGAIDPAILARMLERTNEYMPEASGLSAIRTWTGFRAATPDKLPLIGPWLPTEGVFLAAGHEGLGITTSLATAELLVDHLLGRESKIPQAPYLPSRSFHNVSHN
jgi:glycine/D-amino acid oxidase-like deaminating enzyme